ncbi:hypothetical protein C0989_002468 [Termitomyces sp. Mn162]|nr:hypothetical protein C0989_002468 [Termitomyces sp. Mn162]
MQVIKPEANSTCHGGQRCTIQWLDDGIRPLLAAAGVCTFGLYTGTMQLVQTIPPVDVSATRSISFKRVLRSLLALLQHRSNDRLFRLSSLRSNLYDTHHLFSVFSLDNASFYDYSRHPFDVITTSPYSRRHYDRFYFVANKVHNKIAVFIAVNADPD